jgi:hypothetical protein
LIFGDFFLKLLFEFLGVMTAAIFDMARRAVRLVIIPALGHQMAFVELVEQHVFELTGLEVVVQPDFSRGDKRVDFVVPALGVIDKKQVPDELSVDNPNLDAAAVFSEKLLVNPRKVVFFFEMGLDFLLYEIDLFPLFDLGLIRLGQGVVVRIALRHEPVFEEHVMDEEFLLTGRALVVDPELMGRNESEAEVLAEVGELFVKVVSDVFAVDEIDVEIGDRTDFLKVWFVHGDCIVA